MQIYARASTYFNKERFGTLMYNDVFRFDTFLDTRFGPEYFNECDRCSVIDNLKDYIKNINRNNNELYNKQAKTKSNDDFSSRFIKFTLDSYNEVDNQYNELYDYVRFIRTHKSMDVLDFWKINAERWPVLAQLAAKVLAVPATSAAVERMFSISGHIFQFKRRSMTDKLFSSLVFCKLNEDLL